MNAKAICEIQNIHGQLIHAYCTGQLSERLPLLFACKESKIRLPGLDEFLTSIEQAADIWHKIECKNVQDGVIEVPITHTPVFSIDGDTAKGSWDIYTYRISVKDRTSCLHCDKLEARFVHTDRGWRYSALDWDVLFSFVPETYMEIPKIRRQENIFSYDAAVPEPELWYAARNLLGFVTNNARKSLENWISEDCCFNIEGFENVCGKEQVLSFFSNLNKQEEENGGAYTFLPVLAAPWIVSSSNGLKGRWIAMSFEMNHKEPGYTKPMVRRLG